MPSSLGLALPQSLKLLIIPKPFSTARQRGLSTNRDNNVDTDSTNNRYCVGVDIYILYQDKQNPNGISRQEALHSESQI